MAAFERMEDKVEALEASGQAALELAGEDLESKFAALEGGDDIEKELETLRSQLKFGVETLIDWGEIGKATACGTVTIFPIACLITVWESWSLFFQWSRSAIIIKLLYEFAELPNPGTLIMNLL